MSNYELVYKQCDVCEHESDHVGFAGHSACDKWHRERGWYIDAQQDLCPECLSQLTNGPSDNATECNSDDDT